MLIFPPESLNDPSFVPVDCTVSQASGTLVAVNANGQVKVWKDLFSTSPSSGRTFTISQLQNPQGITLSYEYYSVIISDSDNRILQYSLETDSVVGEFAGIKAPSKMFVSDSNSLHILDQNRIFMMKNVHVNHNDIVTTSLNLNKNVIINDIDGRGDHIFVLSGGKVYIYHEMRKNLEGTHTFGSTYDSIVSHSSGKVLAVCNSLSSHINVFYNHLADRQVNSVLAAPLH
eukprot:TRINITY_DN7196_c0_g1_i1.p1 TRINITY_DN7196_c0_g1~~TRINITY_DN7196_c0_g1_i1.p1  ORF type:complete len:230 (-),score=30.08 TRINITY_DN7196_c0_g1_i1:142-831(-)